MYILSLITNAFNVKYIKKLFFTLKFCISAKNQWISTIHENS